MAKSPCCICDVLPFGVCFMYASYDSLWPQSSSLCEASTRTPVVLDADGWKCQFNVKTHEYTALTIFREIVEAHHWVQVYIKTERNNPYNGWLVGRPTHRQPPSVDILKNESTLQLWDRRFRRRPSLQAVCDTPIAHVTGFVSLRI